MKIITYSLRAENDNANNYYKCAEQLAELVVKEGLCLTKTWIMDYKEFVKKYDIEIPRSDEEYLLELLTLGVLWLRYSDDAVVLNQISKEVLTSLVEMRQKPGKLKLGADFLRGILGTFVLYAEHRPELVAALQFTLKNLINLIEWLAAAGEFGQEVNRLTNWADYLKTVESNKAADLLADAVSFAMWFEEASIEVLGKYTEGIEPYLENVADTHRWREDLIFCSRQRLEYHLNMVGAEILNKAYRKAFEASKRKAILLPACIRKKIHGGCKAREVNGVLYCTGCDKDCQVNIIRSKGQAYDYETMIVPHESSAFSKETIKEGELGIIGIACVTNLLSGGWKAKSLGIPAQCVLLDYCGCKNHWDEEGFSTAIDMERLEEIMDKKMSD